MSQFTAFTGWLLVVQASEQWRAECRAAEKVSQYRPSGLDVSHQPK